MKTKRILALVASIVAITVVHYTTRSRDPLLYSIHLFFRVLYVIPLICGAYWYGFRGAAVTFILITMLYLPHVFLGWKHNLTDNINLLGFVVIFIIVSVTTSVLSSLEAKERKEAEAERALRLRLQHFLSPLVVDEVLTDPDKYELKGKDVEVSVLFADICGFTSLCENLSPHQVMEMLNRIFHNFGEVIFGNEGTLNQIAGDAVMAIFGTPKEQADHADKAVEAAIRLQDAMESLRFGDDITLRIRVGINSGKVTAGSLGSVERMEYTVIGDTVNLANRLCTLAEPGQILISSSTHSLTKSSHSFRSLGEKQVKGRKQLVKVFLFVR